MKPSLNNATDSGDLGLRFYPGQELPVAMRHTAETTVPNTDTMSALRGRPLAFLFAYMRRHPAGHLTVLISVLIAVACSVSTQYGLKHLIDIVATGRDAAGNKVWAA